MKNTPWTIHGEGPDYYWVEDSRGITIANDLIHEVAEALTAAPDLLDALERIKAGEERPETVAWAAIEKIRP